MVLGSNPIPHSFNLITICEQPFSKYSPSFSHWIEILLLLYFKILYVLGSISGSSIFFPTD